MRDETVPIESSLPGQEASLKIQQHTHLVVDDTIYFFHFGILYYDYM